MNNDDSSNWEWLCDVLVCFKYATWLVLSSTYHFLTDDSLQSADKDQQESRAVAGKPHAQCRCKRDTYIDIYSGSTCDSMACLLVLFSHCLGLVFWSSYYRETQCCLTVPCYRTVFWQCYSLWLLYFGQINDDDDDDVLCTKLQYTHSVY